MRAGGIQPPYKVATLCQTARAAAGRVRPPLEILMSSGMRVLAAAALLASSGGVAAQAESAADFYRERTITAVVGFEAGSGNDLLTRLVTKFMREKIPGTPTIVVQNMPGAGGLRAANYLYKVAPHDGSALGFIGRGNLLTPLLDPKSAQFDVHKLNWIGSASRTVMLGVSWHASPVKSLDDAKTHELIVGSPSATSEGTRLALLYNATIGTKFKIVTGYPEPQLVIAMERGEIAGQIGLSYDSLLTTHRDWIDQKRFNFLLQSGFKKDERLANVPLAVDAAKSPADKELMKFLFSIYEVARPFVAPPDVPAERIGALRQAFIAAVHDPRFLAEAAKARIEIVDPVGSDRMTAVIEKAYATPAPIVERARKIVASRP
jgi:tripartite-type tricarboxylate transporter receptor subunit TctC